MNFVCTVFEEGDEMFTLLSMEKQWPNATFINICASNGSLKCHSGDFYHAEFLG